jgi:hypothetical protein
MSGSSRLGATLALGTLVRAKCLHQESNLTR